MTKSETELVVDSLKALGFYVQNWKPGNRRIFKILDHDSLEVTEGMFSDELKAWYKGFIHGQAKGIRK